LLLIEEPGFLLAIKATDKYGNTGTGLRTYTSKNLWGALMKRAKTLKETVSIMFMRIFFILLLFFNFSIFIDIASYASEYTVGNFDNNADLGLWWGWVEYGSHPSNVQIVPTYTSPSGTSYSPMQGSNFLAFDTSLYVSGFYREVDLKKNDIVSGWFSGGPDHSNPRNIIGVATPSIPGMKWVEYKASEVYATSDMPWMEWSFTAPADGKYGLVLYGQGNGPTMGNGYALFDGIKVTSNPTVLIDPPKPTTAPELNNYLQTKNLFSDSVSFIKNQSTSFSTPSQIYLGENLNAMEKFIVKATSGPTWKESFLSGQTIANFLSTATSVFSIASDLKEAGRLTGKALTVVDYPEIAANYIKLSNSFLKLAGIDLAMFAGKETAFKMLDIDYKARAAFESAELMATTGIDLAITGFNPYAFLINTNGIILGYLAGELGKAANDPPDANYKQVFQSRLADITPLNIAGVSQEINKLLGLEIGSIYNTYYFMNGMTTSINRYGSALEAGDALSAGLQFEAFVKYLTLYDAAAIEAAEYVKQFRQYLINQGLADISYNRQDLLDLQNQIKLDGLSQELIDYYKSLGLTDGEIADLIQKMIDFVPPDSISGTLYSNLSDGSNLLLSVSSASAPIPSAVWLFGFGLLSLGVWRRFRKS
jgi:hypothetical protein